MATPVWQFGITQNGYFAFSYGSTAVLSWAPNGTVSNSSGQITITSSSAPDIVSKNTPSTAKNWSFGGSSNDYFVILDNNDYRGLISNSGQIFSIISGNYNILTSTKTVTTPNLASNKQVQVPGSKWSLGENLDNTGLVVCVDSKPVLYLGTDNSVIGATIAGWVKYENQNTNVPQTGPVEDSFYNSVQSFGTGFGEGLIDGASLGLAPLIGHFSPSAAANLDKAAVSIGTGIATATTVVKGAATTVINKISNPDTWNPTKW